MPTNGFNRRSSTHVDSPVTSENGSTSGISGSGSSNGSDATLVNAEETYTSSLFQTEPLYQFYDVSGGSHTIKVRKNLDIIVFVHVKATVNKLI